MKKIRRVLVALDHSKMDEQLLNFSRQFSNLMDLEEIDFVHVIPDFFFPDQLEIPLAGELLVSAPISKLVKTNIEKKVQGFFQDNSNKLKVSVAILEGTPFDRILNYLSTKQIDLLIVGRKKQSEGSGLTAKRVAHQTECHVLFVPENINMALKKIMVPADFSSHSAHAIEMALQLKKRLPEASVQVVHSMRFLAHDYYYGLDQEPVYRKAFQAQKEEDYETMIEKHDLPTEDIDLVFLENPHISASKDLYEYALDEGIDLIIMGAKGHSGFKYLFYGSVTERLVGLCEDIPVWVVR